MERNHRINTNLTNLMGRYLVGIIVTFGAAPIALMAQSHAYINQTRSASTTYVLVQQSIEGETGDYVTQSESKNEANLVQDQKKWTGYSIGTGIGLEALKFFQLSLSHHLLNLRQKEDSTERMSGSRLNLAMKVIFQAPVVNLEIGNGLTASRMDYQRVTETSTFYGTGYNYSLGLSYFASTKVSVYIETKRSKENAERDHGNSAVQSIRSDMTQAGFGARIWL